MSSSQAQMQLPTIPIPTGYMYFEKSNSDILLENTHITGYGNRSYFGFNENDIFFEGKQLPKKLKTINSSCANDWILEYIDKNFNKEIPTYFADNDFSHSKINIDRIFIFHKNNYSEEYAKAKRIIENYLTLSEDWNGYGGQIPSNDIVYTAKHILEKLEECGNIKCPSPMLSGSNEIALAWRSKGKYTEISIDNNQTYSFMSCTVHGNTYDGLEDIAINSLPKKLIEYLVDFD